MCLLLPIPSLLHHICLPACCWPCLCEKEGRKEPAGSDGRWVGGWLLSCLSPVSACAFSAQPHSSLPCPSPASSLTLSSLPAPLSLFSIPSPSLALPSHPLSFLTCLLFLPPSLCLPISCSSVSLCLPSPPLSHETFETFVLWNFGAF